MVKKIEKKQKIELLFTMIKLRMIEEKIASEYPKQEMRCPVHLSIGQEAIATGICKNLSNSDQVFSAHRSHYHYLAKGGNLQKMISELYGKQGGCAGGKGGSMHLIDIKAGLIAAVPIVGSTIPIGVGMAWANKLKKIRNVVVIFFGEGATEEGVFYESLNFAALHKLPVLFVCENNFYSVYSKLNKRQPSIRVIKNVAKSLGVKSYKINGNNIEDIFSQTAELIKKIKKNNSPYFIELDTYRFLEHCGPYNDDKLGYRSKKEIQYWLKRCPINTYQKKLIKDKIIDLNKIEKFKNKTLSQIETVFKIAQSDDFPNTNKLYKNIYAN